MRLLLIALAAAAVAVATAMNLEKLSDPCHRVLCRAGRECVVTGGTAQCLCVTWCPDHDSPVCGTDGESYDNHCLLHQRACIAGKHISVEYRGYCTRDIELAMKEFGMTTTHRPTTTTHRLTTTRSTTTHHPPTTVNPNAYSHLKEDLSVCYGPQRDALRATVIAQWQTSVAKQPWYTQGMTYRESLSGHFFSCDADRDHLLRPDELNQCFTSMPFLPRPEQDLTITRLLCVDSLVDDADTNKDWKLDFQEFTHMLDPLYRPSIKNCSLEGKDYTDGAEVRVDCNHCVCATGSWVCATHDCDHTTPRALTLSKQTFGFMDTKYDLDVTNSIDDANAYGDLSDEDSDEDYDSDEDDDDDYDEDDYDDSSEESAEEIRAEQAKEEYDLLSPEDKKKLQHLENNIKDFYRKVNLLNNQNNTNTSRQTHESLQHINEINVSPLSNNDLDEENALLDYYDELLDKSEKVREKLKSLRNVIHTLEERRRINTNPNIGSITFETRPPATSSDNHGIDITDNDVYLNEIEHGRTQSSYHKKYDNYMGSLLGKQRSQQTMSETDNDIWEDQWKAKIKKHKHLKLTNDV